MAYGESNGNMTNDVMWPKGQHRDPNMLRSQYLETDRDDI